MDREKKISPKTLLHSAGCSIQHLLFMNLKGRQGYNPLFVMRFDECFKKFPLLCATTMADLTI